MLYLAFDGDKEVLKTSLVAAPTHMQHLKYLSVDFLSVSQGLLDTMNNNGVELNQFRFLVDCDNNEQGDEVFTFLQTAQAISTVSFLQLYYDSAPQNIPNHCRRLSNFRRSLNSLSRLDIKCIMCQDFPPFIIELLANLPFLTSVNFEDIHGESYLDYILDETSSSQVVECGLLKSIT